MSFQQDLHTKLQAARKARETKQMTLLGVILGEVSTLKARSGKDLTDEQVENVIRSFVVKNNESLGLMAGKGLEEREGALKEENVFLSSLLPVTLTVAEIKVALSDVSETVRGAKNSGMATGLAMKELKTKNLKVLGDDVKKAVEEMRQ